MSADPLEPSPRVFTLEEANRLLPRVEEFLKSVRKERGGIQSLEKRKAIEELSWLREDGTVSPKAEEAISNLEKFQRKDLRRLEDILKELGSLGVQLKDPEEGLVDFFAARGDSLVYLCWKEGEDQIRYWHDLESGFAGRRPIEEW